MLLCPNVHQHLCDVWCVHPRLGARFYKGEQVKMLPSHPAEEDNLRQVINYKCAECRKEMLRVYLILSRDGAGIQGRLPGGGSTSAGFLKDEEELGKGAEELSWQRMANIKTSNQERTGLYTKAEDTYLQSHNNNGSHWQSTFVCLELFCTFREHQCISSHNSMRQMNCYPHSSVRGKEKFNNPLKLTQLGSGQGWGGGPGISL